MYSENISTPLQSTKIPFLFSKSDMQFPISRQVEAFYLSDSSKFSRLGDLLSQSVTNRNNNKWKSDETLDSKSKPDKKLFFFELTQERVIQQRTISVDREQCSKKEHAHMNYENDTNVKHHRAVTVSRSNTWSIADSKRNNKNNSIKNIERPTFLNLKSKSLAKYTDDSSGTDVSSPDFDVAHKRRRPCSNIVRAFSLLDKDFKQKLYYLHWPEGENKKSVEKGDEEDEKIFEEKLKMNEKYLIQKCTILQRADQGLGLTVAGCNPVFVKSVKPDGSAARSGVMLGDKIIKVNGALVLKKNHNEVVNLMKSGSYVALTLLGRESKLHNNFQTQIRDLLDEDIELLDMSPNDIKKFDSKSTCLPKELSYKDQELRAQKFVTIKMMEEQIKNEYEIMLCDYIRSPSEQLQMHLDVKQQMLSRVRNQLKEFDITESKQIEDQVISETRHRKTGSNPECSKFSISNISDMQMSDYADRIFNNIECLKNHPAHVAVFLHYLLSNDDPTSMLFYLMSEFYAYGSIKDSRKNAYEIFSTFIHQQAPLKMSMTDLQINEIESILISKQDGDESLRNIFHNARQVAAEEINDFLSDFSNKRSLGLGSLFGDNELKENMDKNTEFKIIENTLWKHFEGLITQKDNDQCSAIISVLATYFKQVGFSPNSKINSKYDRIPIFNARALTGLFKFPKSIKKSINGHQLIMQQFSSSTYCQQCQHLLWGPAYQGMQCTLCEIALHKQCRDKYDGICFKKKDRRSPSMFNRIIAKKLGKDNLIKYDDSSFTINTRYSCTKEDDESGSIRNSEITLITTNDSDKYFQVSPSRDLISPSQLNDSFESSSTSSLSNVIEATKRPENEDLSCILSGNNLTNLLEVETDLPSLDVVFSKEALKKMKPKERKQNEVLNEIIHTEIVHMRNLAVMYEYFYVPMLQEPTITKDFLELIFPNIEEIICLHGYLKETLISARNENKIVENIDSIFLNQFSGLRGEKFKNATAKFCQHQSAAIEVLKLRQKKDPKFASLLQEASANAYCRRFELKDLLPIEMQRLTKYPLLIANLIQFSSNKNNLLNSLELTKEILNFVNQQIEVSENQHCLDELQKRLDTKLIENSNHPAISEYKKLNLTQHKLIYKGFLKWRINKTKNIELVVVLLEDILVLLQKGPDDKLILRCQSTNMSPAKDEAKFTHSPIVNLKNLIIRDVATDKRAFFIVSVFDYLPQIYELVATSMDEKKRWVRQITMAAEAMKKNNKIFEEIDESDAGELINESINNSINPFMEEVASVNITAINPQIYMQSVSYNYLHGFQGSSTDSLDESSCDEIRKQAKFRHHDKIKISKAQEIENPNKIAMYLIEKIFKEDNALRAILDQKRMLQAEFLHITPENFDYSSKPINEDEISVSKIQQLLLATISQVDKLNEIVQSNQLFNSNQNKISISDIVDDDEVSHKSMLVSASQITHINYQLQSLILQLIEVILKKDVNKEIIPKESEIESLTEL